MTEAEKVLKEFVHDVEAIGVRQTALEWPDLVITYRKAKAVLDQSKKTN